MRGQLSSLILSTHLRKINKDLSEELKNFTPGKSSFMTRLKKTDMKGNEPKTELGNWLYEKERTCYVCDHFESIYGRYLDTFFHLYKKDKDFRQLYLGSKGFCLHHFKDLVEAAENKLTDDEKKDFYQRKRDFSLGD